jgi:hypothetical protein
VTRLGENRPTGDCLLWAVFLKYRSSPKVLGDYFPNVLILTKIGLAIFSQTHLVAVVRI